MQHCGSYIEVHTSPPGIALRISLHKYVLNYLTTNFFAFLSQAQKMFQLKSGNSIA